jgi:hypothetical protein
MELARALFAGIRAAPDGGRSRVLTATSRIAKAPKIIGAVWRTA